MAEYTLGITDVCNEQSQNVRGFLVTIEPPVDLSPDAVDAAITRDTLNPNTPNRADTDLERATLVGSSNTRTAIYVSLPSEKYGEGYDGYDTEMLDDHRNDIERGVKGLLNILGIPEKMIEVQAAAESTPHYLLKY